MKLNMELLYDSLEQYSPKTHFLSGDSSLRLIGPRLWGGEASVKPDYVYLATAERLMTCDNISTLGNIICMSTTGNTEWNTSIHSISICAANEAPQKQQKHFLFTKTRLPIASTVSMAF